MGRFHNIFNYDASPVFEAGSISRVNNNNVKVVIFVARKDLGKNEICVHKLGINMQRSVIKKYIYIKRAVLLLNRWK